MVVEDRKLLNRIINNTTLNLNFNAKILNEILLTDLIRHYVEQKDFSSIKHIIAKAKLNFETNWFTLLNSISYKGKNLMDLKEELPFQLQKFIEFLHAVDKLKLIDAAANPELFINGIKNDLTPLAILSEAKLCFILIYEIILKVLKHDPTLLETWLQALEQTSLKNDLNNAYVNCALQYAFLGDRQHAQFYLDKLAGSKMPPRYLKDLAMKVSNLFNQYENEKLRRAVANLTAKNITVEKRLVELEDKLNSVISAFHKNEIPLVAIVKEEPLRNEINEGEISMVDLTNEFYEPLLFSTESQEMNDVSNVIDVGSSSSFVDERHISFRKYN